jgi:hypothetical protein
MQGHYSQSMMIKTEQLVATRILFLESLVSITEEKSIFSSEHVTPFVQNYHEIRSSIPPPAILQIAVRRFGIEVVVRARAILPRICIFVVEELREDRQVSNALPENTAHAHACMNLP